MAEVAKQSESRQFSRSAVATRVQIRLESGVLVEGEAHDISLNGALVTTERLLPVGNNVRLTLVLDGGEGEYRIETKGRVARVEEHGVAVRFSAIDAESLEHLRMLVLYNASDAEQVEREFGEHTGLKPKAK